MIRIKEAVVYDSGGAMVIVILNGLQIREYDLDRKWLTAMRNALHKALARVYPGLKIIRLPRGNDDKAWDKIVQAYEEQVRRLGGVSSHRG